MNKKSGFTLAEVLVTLMIIGVIAAMTVPSLMQTTAQQEYKAALKKAMSTLNQALTLHYALESTTAADHTDALVTELFAKRMNVVESTGETEFYTADGIYYQISDPTACSYDYENPDLATTVCADIIVDVNGKKGPNTKTENTKSVKDQYEFKLYPQKVTADGVTAKVLYMK